MQAAPAGRAIRTPEPFEQRRAAVRAGYIKRDEPESTHPGQGWCLHMKMENSSGSGQALSFVFPHCWTKVICNLLPTTENRR